MITALGGVSIWSSDLNNLLPFYRDVVGLPVQMDGSDGSGFALLGEPNKPALGIGTHSDVRGASTDPFRIMVGFTTTDIQADFARMKAAGARFHRRAEPPTRRRTLARHLQGSGRQHLPALPVRLTPAARRACRT